MNLAYAHGGVDHTVSPAAVSLLTDWAFDPTFLVPLLLAVLYCKGYVRYRRRGGRHFPAWRPLLFTVGLAMLAVALMSPVDLLADASFTWHMVQHDVLMLVALPLLLLGAPFIPVVRGLPAGLRRRVFIPFARQGAVRAVVRFITRPVVALVLYEGTLLLWHLPAFYDAALFNPWAHYAMHLSFIVTGLCFWWNLVTPYPFPSLLHPLLRVLMLFASSVVNSGLSAMIVFSDSVLYGYETQPGFWGLTMLTDQEIGSGLMWVMGGMLRLAAITAIFITYAVQENAKEPALQAARARDAQARAMRKAQGDGAPQGA